MYKCNECQKTFTRKSSVNRHRKESCLNQSSSKRKRKNNNPKGMEPVKKVKRDFTKRVSKLVLCVCKQCNQHYFKNKLSAHLKSNYHKSKVLKNYKDNVKVVTSAFKNRIISYMLLPSKIFVNIDDFF